MLDIKKLLAKLIEASSLDYNHPIGSAYSTTDASFDPNNVWGGTWKKLPEGYVLLSGSSDGSYIVGTDTSKTSGYKEYGENSHTLTTNEMPSHTHIQNAHNHSLNGHTHSIGNGLGVTGGTWSGDSASPLSGSGNKYGYTSDKGTQIKTLTATGGNSNNTGDKTATNQNAGGGQAHNNMQKSIAVYWWIRTA